MHCVLTDGWEVFIPFAFWTCILMSGANVIRPGLEMHVNVGCESQTSTLHWFSDSLSAAFMCHFLHYTENKHSFANTIWPRSASTDLKHKCPHPMPEGGNMMEARAPFLSAALPTDLEPSGAKTQCTARLAKAVHLPVTPSDWQDPGVIFSTLPG